MSKPEYYHLRNPRNGQLERYLKVKAEPETPLVAVTVRNSEGAATKIINEPSNFVRFSAPCADEPTEKVFFDVAEDGTVKSIIGVL